MQSGGDRSFLLNGRQRTLRLTTPVLNNETGTTNTRTGAVITHSAMSPAPSPPRPGTTVPLTLSMLSHRHRQAMLTCPARCRGAQLWFNCVFAGTLSFNSWNMYALSVLGGDDYMSTCLSGFRTRMALARSSSVAPTRRQKVQINRSCGSVRFDCHLVVESSPPPGEPRKGGLGSVSSVDLVLTRDQTEGLPYEMWRLRWSADGGQRLACGAKSNSRVPPSESQEPGGCHRESICSAYQYVQLWARRSAPLAPERSRRARPPRGHPYRFGD